MQYYYPPYYGAVQDTLGQFKTPYQMQQAPVQMPMQQPQRQQGNDFIWVQGEAGAKAYLVAPGSTVILWDSESPTIYVKSADATGMPNMKVLDFTERTEAAHKCRCEEKYVTAEQFDELKAEFEKLKEGMVKANG